MTIIYENSDIIIIKKDSNLDISEFRRAHPIIQFINMIFKCSHIKKYRNNTVILFSDLKIYVNYLKNCLNNSKKLIAFDEIPKYFYENRKDIEEGLKNINFNKIIMRYGFLKRRSRYRDETNDRQIIENFNQSYHI